MCNLHTTHKDNAFAFTSHTSHKSRGSFIKHSLADYEMSKIIGEKKKRKKKHRKLSKLKFSKTSVYWSSQVNLEFHVFPFFFFLFIAGYSNSNLEVANMLSLLK